MRSSYKYPNDSRFEINRLLSYTKTFKCSTVLVSNNNSQDAYSSYDVIVAFGEIEGLSSNTNSFNKLREFHLKHKDWMFGFLSYDLKNEIEKLSSNNIDNFNFPNLLFYIPETVLLISENEVVIESVLSEKEIDTLVEELNEIDICKNDRSPIYLQYRQTKKDYINTVKKIKSHIQNGDIYEMTYCHELYQEGEDINPRKVFRDLNSISNAPFSVFFNYGSRYLICSSPERFLRKKGDKIIAQPIKGTRKRGSNHEKDTNLISELRNSEKDKSENVMIVDLVRNDLSKTAKRASVKVEELFGIYTFDMVHQMITTITSEIDDQYDFVDLLESTFPMGSMTGAPKIKSMELIEQYETTKRSLFSSAFGYITPASDFDFNVVIRSILYNEINKYISVIVGGAITINSNEIEEYEECLTKAKAMIKVLRDEE